MKKRINFPLIIGLCILLLIVVVMLFPEALTSRSPYTIQTIRYIHIDGELDIERAPFPPSVSFPLGSDELGRDVWSFIVYGTQLTVLLGLLVAFGRFVIALPLALHAGFGHKGTDGFIRQFNILFSAIPALLISIIVLNLDFFKGLDKNRSIWAFVIVLSGIGWPRMARLLQNRIEWLNKQSFVKGATAIGKHPLKIAIENVIPHLVPEMTVLFFMEIARALSMIMQLGVFGVFIGNLRIIKDADFGNMTYYDISFEPEWASMLGASKNYITAAPWVIIFPAIAFFITVLALNLFGEGLREVMQNKDSKAIPIIRKVTTFNFKGLRSLLSTKDIRRIAVVTIVICLVAVTVKASEIGRYDFDIGNADVTLYDNVVVGTPEATDRAETIVETMKNLGIKPIEDTYVFPYDIMSPYFIENKVMHIGETELDSGSYAFVKSPVEAISKEIVDATKMDLYSLEDYAIFEDKFILIDTAYYNQRWIESFAKKVSASIDFPGVILIVEDNTDMALPLSVASAEAWEIILQRSAADTYLSGSSMTVAVSAVQTKVEGHGQNILGLFEGTDPDMKDEAIIVAMNYNHLTNDGNEVMAFNLELMKRLCGLTNNRRSILFVFLDGTISERHHGIYPLEEDFPFTIEKSQVFVDLTGIEASTFDNVELSTLQAPITRQFAWNVGYKFETLFKEGGIKTQQLEAIDNGGEFMHTKNYSDNVIFWDIGIANIVVNTREGDTYHLNDLGKIILKTIGENNY